VRRLTLAAVLLAAGVAAFPLLRPAPQVAPAPEPSDRVVLANSHGSWTIFTRCIPGVVGPGYVARLETAAGRVLVDDQIGPGTLNDTDFGGLGAFGWHHARGRSRERPDPPHAAV
jgi:hypothetical protein